MSGSSLRERLGRLRGLSGPGAAAAAADALEAANPRQAEEPAAGRTDSETKAWQRLGFALRQGPQGECLTREVTYGADYRHGRYAVKEFASAIAALARLDPAGQGAEAERMLFLDMETTGLGQGTGNIPFLVGLGWWADGNFTIRQHIIRHPGEEAAMLAMLAELLPAFTHLATYNGRAFDWPLMKSRFILHRMKPPRDLTHFDFLHPSRSLWRTTLPSVRLGAVEEAKLGIVREEDIPGAMAPQLYFQYLAERDASLLAGVIRHNETDIATLMTLAIHFGRLLSDGAAVFGELASPELLRLGLWYERLGFENEACAAMHVLYARFAAEEHHAAQRWELWSEAAQFFKRRRCWAEAIRLWSALAEAEAERTFARIEPFVELAIAFEHRLCDFRAALNWTDKALNALDRRLSFAMRGGQDDKLRRMRAELLHRRERLIRKLGGEIGSLF